MDTNGDLGIMSHVTFTENAGICHRNISFYCVDSKLVSLEYPEDGPQTDLHLVSRTNCLVTLQGLLGGTSWTWYPETRGSERFVTPLPRIKGGVNIHRGFRFVHGLSVSLDLSKAPLCSNPSLCHSFLHPPYPRRFPTVSDYKNSHFLVVRPVVLDSDSNRRLNRKWREKRLPEAGGCGGTLEDIKHAE